MNEDFSLRPDEIALIRPFLHDCLRRVISKDRPDQIDEDEFWQPVQVEFDGGAFQVYNDLVVANYFDGKEDCGRMSVLPPEKIPEPAYVMEINQPVKNMVQSFFLWDERCVTGQWRLMSMSFKKKYSSSG